MENQENPQANQKGEEQPTSEVNNPSTRHPKKTGANLILPKPSGALDKIMTKNSKNKLGFLTVPFSSSVPRGLEPDKLEPTKSSRSFSSLPNIQNPEASCSTAVNVYSDNERIRELEKENMSLRCRISSYLNIIRELESQKVSGGNPIKPLEELEKYEEEPPMEPGKKVENEETSRCVCSAKERHDKLDKHRATLERPPVKMQPKYAKHKLYIICKTARPDGDENWIVWNPLVLNDTQYDYWQKTLVKVYAHAHARFLLEEAGKTQKEQLQACQFCKKCGKSQKCIRSELCEYFMLCFYEGKKSRDESLAEEEK